MIRLPTRTWPSAWSTSIDWRKQERFSTRRFHGNLTTFWIRLPLYNWAFLQGDEPEMRKQLAWAAGRPGEEEAIFLCAVRPTPRPFTDGSVNPTNTPAARLIPNCGQTRKKALLRIRRTQPCGRRSSGIWFRRERMLRARWLCRLVEMER